MRFQDPIPKREWKDAYDALNFKASCLQKDVLGGNPDDLVGDEDCLFINVFTPRVPSQNGRVPNQASLLSVMVWIHGGSWDFGDGRIDPTPIVNQNIIVVSMNYRLGPLGFLNLGTAKIAGNQGLKDQLEALRWVNANILSFGGDPNKVTLFGQSSGAVSAHLHQISPQGAGLYRAIIAQSGSALSHMVEPLNRRVVERESRRYVDKIGCSQGGSVALAEIMTCLFQKNVEDLLFEPMEETESVEVRLELEGEVPNNLIQNTLDGVGPFDSFGPSMDEQSDNPFIPEHPYLAIKAGHQKDLPIILGISSNDGGIKMAQYWDKLNAVNGNWSYYGPKIVLNLPFDRTKRYDRLISNVTRHFYTGKADLSIDESQGIVDMMTDSAFRAPALKASHLQARKV
jgi:bile salt-stimulated lipase